MDLYLGGLYSGGLIFGGGAYIWNEVSVSICGGLIFSRDVPDTVLPGTG